MGMCIMKTNKLLSLLTEGLFNKRRGGLSWVVWKRLLEPEEGRGQGLHGKAEYEVFWGREVRKTSLMRRTLKEVNGDTCGPHP